MPTYTHHKIIYVQFLFQDEEDHSQTRPQRAQEEWMLICQRTANLQPGSSSQEDFDWTAAAQCYPNLDEMPTFVTRNRQQIGPRTFTTSASPENLQERQLEVYTTVKDHYLNNNPTPLRIIVMGTAGTGKSYLIQCIRLLLGDTLKVSAPTGVASFIIEGTTLHSLLYLPTRGEFKQLEGNRLHRLWLGEKYLDRSSFPPSCSRSFWWMLAAAVWRFWSTATSYGSTSLHN